MQDQIKDIIEKEERQFAQTLAHGMKHLEENLLIISRSCLAI